MNINAISESGFTLNRINEVTQNEESGFKKVFSKLLEATAAADTADKAENVSFISGGNTNPHDVMIAAEKADLTLNLTLEIRNKVIDAYNEIMRMQI